MSPAECDEAIHKVMVVAKPGVRLGGLGVTLFPVAGATGTTGVP